MSRSIASSFVGTVAVLVASSSAWAQVTPATQPVASGTSLAQFFMTLLYGSMVVGLFLYAHLSSRRPMKKSLGQIDASLALTEESLKLMREQVRLQTETNRLLTEWVEKSQRT